MTSDTQQPDERGTLRLALAQISVKQSDPRANLEKAADFSAQAAACGAHMICFPEMWTTGFHWDWNSRFAAQQNDVIVQAAGIAKSAGIWLAGSMLSPNPTGLPSNALHVFDPQGNIRARYGKAHLFGPFQEQVHIAPGEELVILDAPWGKTGLSVCYDLRFPELFRSYAVQGVRLQLLPAAFPQPRIEHWKILLRARAIENQMFVAAVNQVGTETFADGSAAEYFGTSCVIDPWGNALAEGGAGSEELLIADMDLQESDTVRGKMNVLGDRRPGVYRLGAG